MNGCLSMILKRCLLAITVISLTMTVNSSNLFAYGGGDGGGSGGGGGGGGGEPPGNITIDIWSIPTALDEPGGLPGGTVQLQTPDQLEMKRVWEGLGGRSGTGKSYDDWKNSDRAGKALIQQRLEREAAQAQSSSSRINIATVTLEYIDEGGRGVQVGLSFVPAVGTGASVGLDASREFVDVYRKALESGASPSDAIAQGLKSATVKGGTTAATSGLIGGVAGKLWEKANRITGGRAKDVAKRGSHRIVSLGLKMSEFATNAGIDEIRSKVDTKAPRNQAPQPQQAVYQTQYAR